MKIDICPAQQEMTQTHREEITSLLQSALGRVAQHVSHLEVRLAAAKSFSPQTKTHCILTAHLIPAGNVRVEVLGPNRKTALHDATDRLRQTIAHERGCEKPPRLRRPTVTVRSASEIFRPVEPTTSSSAHAV